MGVCQGGCCASAFPKGDNIDGNDFLDFGSKIQNSSSLFKVFGIAFLALEKGNGTKFSIPLFGMGNKYSDQKIQIQQ